MNKIYQKIILLAVVALISVSAFAQTLDELNRQVRDTAARQGQINQQREAEFVSERNRQRQLLQQARSELAEQRRSSDSLQAEFDANELALAEQEIILEERLGNLGELFGVVRQVAGDLEGVLQGSLVSAQYPGRSEFFGTLAARDELPTGKELARFWSEMVNEITEQGKVVEFTATVNKGGVDQEGQSVLRVGVFNVVSNGQFLIWDGDRLIELPRQPAGRFQNMANDLQNASVGTISPMAIDMSNGTILTQVVQSPTLAERVRQGKEVGYVIIAIGALGLLFSLWKGLVLFLKGVAIRGQMRKDEPNKGNALGRVMAIYTESPDADIETLELKLDEAILRETAPLESGLSFIKVLYVIAPLLGLLGTVVGMITTFQQITLFGTGDPRMMAGGISTALVTTVLGLIVAIPLTILHSLLQARSRSLIQILEEQAAGIISRLAERHHAGS